MPVQWCTHPTSHHDCTKIDHKPTHPRGDRKVDGELAAFISESYRVSTGDEGILIQAGDLFCRTCYDKERSKFDSHLILQKSTDEGNESMDTDDQRPRRQRKTMSNMEFRSNLDFPLEEKAESSCSQSSSESETIDDEKRYNQEKTTHLLNQVFSVLNISQISDM